MAPGTASIWLDRPSHVRSLNSSSAWLVRIVAGDTIALPVHWTTSVIVSPIQPSATSYAASAFLRLPSVTSR